MFASTGRLNNKREEVEQKGEKKNKLLGGEDKLNGLKDSCKWQRENGGLGRVIWEVKGL